MEKMKLELFQVECKLCGAKYTKTVGPDYAYPWAMFSTVQGEEVFMNTGESKDPIWQEISEMNDEILEGIEAPGTYIDKVGAFHEALGYAIDLSPNGYRYFVGGSTPCRQCNNFEGLSSRPMSQSREVEFKEAMHHEWNKKSGEEKRKIVEKAIFNYLKRKREHLDKIEKEWRAQGWTPTKPS